VRHLVLILALLIFSSLSAQQRTISGFIKDNKTSEALIGSTVINLKTGQGSVANAYGFFSLTQPIGDTVYLRFSYVGYQPQIIKFFHRGDTLINANLSGSVSLQEVEVIGNRVEKIHTKTQMSSIDISMETVKNLPVFLGEVDVLKTIQLLPGVQSGSEGSAGLYVRGGGPDQNLILLDGVPVYNANHLFGFFSVFNADAINSVQLIKGGFPARYGGRLSSVIDIRMKEGNMNEFHGEVSVGIVAAKATFEGPIIKDKTSFIISARRTYLDLLARPFFALSEEDVIGGYFFYDFNAKINHKFSDKSRLYFSNYFGDDKFYFRYKDSYTFGGNTYEDRSESSLGWGNAISALRWNYIVNPRLFSNTTLTYSRYRFKVGFLQEDTFIESGVKTTDTFSYDYFSGIQDWGLKTDFDFMPNPNHYIRFGVGNTYHKFTPGVNQFIEKEGNDAIIDTVFGSQKQYAHELYAYIEDEILINNRASANVGLHTVAFILPQRNYFSLQPRFSARYLTSENGAVKGSFATMSQFLHLLSNTSIGLPTDLWLPATERIPPQISSIGAIGYAHTIKNKYELSVESFYKHMDGLIEYKDGASFLGSSQDWQNLVEIGRGWAYGTEFLIEKKQGKTTGWIGYTLSWAYRQFDEINFGSPFPYRFDRRHDIGLAITHKFSEKFDMGVVWVYGTGNAVTLALERYQPLPGFNIFNNVEHIESRNNFRMPAYHRLDVGFNFRKEKKKTIETWSLALYNAYNRQNPFFLYFKNNNQGERGLYQVSLFPIIPSLTYSFKF
jgi:hypothetical protein